MKVTKETRRKERRKEDLVRVSWRSADVVFLLDTVRCEHGCLPVISSNWFCPGGVHISTTLTLMLVQLVQSQCDWCGTEYRAVCCTDSVTETLWFCSHDSVFRNIFTEHKVTQRETLIPISLLLPHHLAPFFFSPLPLNPVSCPKAQAAGWEVGGKRSQVPLFDRAVAAFVLQAKTLPQTCTNTSTALLVFKVTPTDMLLGPVCERGSAPAVDNKWRKPLCLPCASEIWEGFVETQLLVFKDAVSDVCDTSE